MKELNQFLSRSFRWIGFEALSYQLILLVHQVVLFRMVDYTLYGTIGALFSLVYLFVAITDLGLESSLSPFFSEIIKYKNTFKQFLRVQLAPNILAVLVLFVLLLTAKVVSASWGFSLLQKIDVRLFFLLGALVLSENLKKTARTAMHLAFLNRDVAFIEFGTIVGYVAAVWGVYAFGYPINVWLIFVPMFASSVVSTGLMLFLLHRFSSSLADKKIGHISDLKKRVIKSRCFNFLNQLSHQIFSSNFLVPFFALQFGFAHAGVFKLVSHIAYCTTGVLRKLFGITSDAMLAKTKSMVLEAKQAVFSRITQQLYHALCGVVLFFVINYHKIAAYPSTSSGQATLSPLAYLFLVICLSENLFITYEKLYITQERTGRLLAFNLLTMALTGGIILYATNLSPLGVLFAILAVRAVMFVLLSIASFYTWNIVPQWKLQPRYVLFALGCAVGFFVLF